MLLDEIRMMFKADNASMLDGALQSMERQMAARLADQEARFMREISALQNRMEQLELRARDRNDGNDEPAVQEVKRPRRNLNADNGNVGMGSNARDLPASRRHDEVERHTVVFSGFSAKSRKRLLIDYVKLQLPVVERLAGHADVSDLGDKVFAPSIRTNIVMIRLPNKTAMFRFLNAWKQADEAGQISRFGDEELGSGPRGTNHLRSEGPTENSGNSSFISKTLDKVTLKSIGETARCGSKIMKL